MPPLHHVLIVGAGSIGERHVRCFLASGRARVSFVEINGDLRAGIAERYSGVEAYASLQAAVEQPVDAAVIATPAPLHVDQARQLVERGIHVLIEKPLSVSLDGVEALSEAVERKKIVAAVAYVMRAQPALAGMRQAIVSGEFGRPLELLAVSGQDFAFYRPAYRSTYYAKRESGGGAIQDALTHLLNAGQWIAGEIDRVIADAAHLKIEGVEVEDTVHVLTRHGAQGAIPASYSLNQHQPANETTITVICEHGMARYEAHRARWRSTRKAGEPWTDHDAGALDRDAPFIRQANQFLDAIEKKTQPLCSLDEGAATLRANLAILRSADSGQWTSTQF